jgi:hypothetical protein
VVRRVPKFQNVLPTGIQQMVVTNTRLKDVFDSLGQRSAHPAMAEQLAFYDGDGDQAKEPWHRVTARALANIAKWRTYLPPDCVATMIAMEWHLST